ncbi:hypothetical protein [Shimia abyssi]|uniref:Phosphotransferase family enzyme n=1 Tax=Shimia abyssi TaxID=1662395 RepID=A0A2P8FJ17_9RHOB|nr:hypothetical protein [Shimia abyssi]PSL21714.1 hypothetical protein CLV88_101138 [Shimia abyssi]
MNMPRTARAITSEPHHTQWHGLVKSQLSGRFDAIARLVSGRKPGARLDFDLIKYGHSAISLQVHAGGRCAYMKLFDMSQPDSAYQREKASLCALRDSGLVPRILGFSDSPRFIVCEWSDLARHAYAPLTETPDEFAYSLGKWLAELDSAVPGETAVGNWYGYLTKFGTALDLERISIAREVLSEIPLCGRALSRNDAALHNFLVNAEGHLLGCDFENARMRPRGWDYVLGHIGLVERFPEKIDTVIRAYSDGFSNAHRGALIVEELNVVSRILFCARAMAGDNTENVVPWR